MTKSGASEDDNEAPEEFLAAADDDNVELPHASEVVARQKRAEAAAQMSVGSKKPVDSGTRQHPQLRAQAGAAKGKKR